MYFYSYILIISLIVISLVTWIEFYGLIIKIYVKNNFINKFKRFIFKVFSLLFLSFVTFLIVATEVKSPDMKIFIIYSLLVSILSDMGGMIIGKTLKGKKLTKISPNKTVSGSIGAFIFSLILVPFFDQNLSNHSVGTLIIITLLISLTSQIGDLFISLIKRKARVKDTSDLLPGHGGFLDRIDGILFAIPIGFLLFNLL
jgi:phosphatidate cytidylyltransferase|tara:strand:- start:163 stop:762 length:600 start_codon:yes stop_codon:yes gene_type:complete